MSKKIQRKFRSTEAAKFEFNPDYTPVKRDLKRIGLLAGIFLAILVVLALFQDSLMALLIK